MGEHRRGFVAERSLVSFCQIMADHFQDEISTARNEGRDIFAPIRFGLRDELNRNPITLVSTKA